MNRSCQVLTGKKLSPRPCGAWRPRQAFGCCFSGLISISTTVCFSSPAPYGFLQSRAKQNNSTACVHLSFGRIRPLLGLLNLIGSRCDWPLAIAYDDCVRPARCLCRSSDSEWVSVETTPQRPKILKPPPNHPPQNKPSNRNQASASRSHRFPIAPSIPVHVSSLDSAATSPQIIRHSRSSPAGCTRPEWVPALPACLPRYPGPMQAFSLVIVSKSYSSLPMIHCSPAASVAPRHASEPPLMGNTRLQQSTVN